MDFEKISSLIVDKSISDAEVEAAWEAFGAEWDKKYSGGPVGSEDFARFQALRKILYKYRPQLDWKFFGHRM